MRTIFGILTAILLVACETSQISNKKQFDLSLVDRLKAGQSTMETSKNLFGTADNVENKPNEIIWRYRYGKNRTEQLALAFDSNSKILRWYLVDTRQIAEVRALGQLLDRYPNLKISTETAPQTNNETYYRDDLIANQFAIYDSLKSEVVAIGWYDPSLRSPAALAQPKQ